LEETGILKFESGTGSKCPKEYKSVRVLLTRGQLEEAIGELEYLPDHLKKWAMSS
jgi:hypothetical protein